MKSFMFWPILLGIGSLLIMGCQSTSVDESKLPWARPASWEGAPPGMSGLPGMAGPSR